MSTITIIKLADATTALVPNQNGYLNQLPIAPEQGPGPVKAMGAYATPKPSPAKNMIAMSEDCAALLGLTADDLQSDLWQQLLSGNASLEEQPSFAMNYAGHQFGNWAGQLGDGRAIVIADVLAGANKYMLQLKGAGPTAFSRRGDGYAVLRSSIREFLCSEAMHALGVPTTRALSLVTRGEAVWRDMFYDGRPALEPSAVVCRVAPSFIRFGHFELLASRGDKAQLQSFILFCVSSYFPDIAAQYAADIKEGICSIGLVTAFFESICSSTAALVAHWQSIGFTHGVLNTDNMSIHGVTIDYGPYGWLEPYEPSWTPNTTDAHGRRYAFGQQPKICMWNLWQLANALAFALDDSSKLSAELGRFQGKYWAAYSKRMAPKLGVSSVSQAFLEELEAFMEAAKVDMTVFFRGLAQVHTLEEFHSHVLASSYKEPELSADVSQAFWGEYDALLNQLGLDNRADTMNAHNPLYVLRNYLAYQAIEKAEQGDYAMIHQLQKVLSNPFEDQGYPELSTKRPDWAAETPGCSALSCSS